MFWLFPFLFCCCFVVSSELFGFFVLLALGFQLFQRMNCSTSFEQHINWFQVKLHSWTIIMIFIIKFKLLIKNKISVQEIMASSKGLYMIMMKRWHLHFLLLYPSLICLWEFVLSPSTSALLLCFFGSLGISWEHLRQSCILPQEGTHVSRAFQTPLWAPFGRVREESRSSRVSYWSPYMSKTTVCTYIGISILVTNRAKEAQ